MRWCTENQSSRIKIGNTMIKSCREYLGSQIRKHYSLVLKCPPSGSHPCLDSERVIYYPDNLFPHTTYGQSTLWTSWKNQYRILRILGTTVPHLLSRSYHTDNHGWPCRLEYPERIEPLREARYHLRRYELSWNESDRYGLPRHR